MKMNYPCENEVKVNNENALWFSTFTNPPPVLEYINSIASSVGTDHILAVFEDTDSIKVYFDDKRFVDTFIRKGLHVAGRHVKVDYVVPPGVKLILSKIDPVITNFDLMRLLSMFGKIVSPIISTPLSDDAKLCHIMGGVRYVYMILEKDIPERLDFKYGNQLCTIHVQMGATPELPVIKMDSDVDFQDAVSNSAPDLPSVEHSQSQEVMDPVVVSVHYAPLENNSGTHESDITGENIDSNGNTPNNADSNHSAMTVPPLKIRYNYRTYKRKRRRWLNAANRFAKARGSWQKRKMPLLFSATSGESHIPTSVKSSPVSLEMDCASPSLKENISPEINCISTSLNENVSPEINCSSAAMKEETLSPHLVKGSTSKSNQSSPLVIEENSLPVLQNETSLKTFNDEELLQFLNKMKYHREPLKFTMMHLKTRNPLALKLFVIQLQEFRHRQKSLTLRIRLDRLIKLLSQAF